MHIENQLGTKHVEGIVIACLDEGSNPSGSTIKRNWFAIYNIKSPTSLLGRALLSHVNLNQIISNKKSPNRHLF